jgi:hypothetical protein
MSTSNPSEVDNPFEEYLKTDSLLIDLTEKLETKGKETFKVRLLQLSDSVVVKKKHGPATLDVYESMVTSPKSIEGTLTVDNMPTESTVFKLYYHMFDGLLEFGILESSASIYNVITKDNFYYFKDNEGVWRLEIVTDYN